MQTPKPPKKVKRWILNQYCLWVPFRAERSYNTCGMGIDYKTIKVPAFKNLVFQKCQVIGSESWQADKRYLVSQWLRATGNEIVTQREE